MRTWGHAQYLRRATRDFAVAVVLGGMVAMTAALGADATISIPAAHASDIFIEAVEDIGTLESESSPLAALSRCQPGAALAGLALAFALLSAFNLTLIGHFRRAYASPRRTWRGNR